MTKLEELYRKNVVHSTLESLINWATQMDRSGLSDFDNEKYEQLVFLLVYCRQVLEMFNVNFLLPTGDTQSAVLGNLQQQLTGVLSVLHGNTDQKKAINDAIIRFLNNVVPYIKEFTVHNGTVIDAAIVNQAKDLVEKSSEDLVALNSKKQVLDEQIRVLTLKIEEFEKTIINQQSRIDEQIVNYTTATNDRINQSDANFSDRLNVLLTTGEASINATMEEITKSKTQAADIVQLISAGAVSSGYKEQSDKHKAAFNLWRGGAFLGMAASSGFAVYFTMQSGSSLDWQHILTKLVSSFVILLPSFYAAREAEKHRKQSEIYRKFALELATLDPYINDFVTTKQQEIKEKLIGQYFNGSINDKESLDKEDKDLLVKLVETVKEVPSKIIDKVLSH